MERWRDIEGYNGRYQISDCGIVKSVARSYVVHNGGVRNLKDSLLFINTDRNGYHFVGVSKNGIRKCPKIHRLVASNFIKNPHNKPEVNHINGIKNDNRVDNLEWATKSENIRHSFDVLGRSHPTGADHHRSKKCTQYYPSGKLLRVFDSITEASNEMGVTLAAISIAITTGTKSRGYLWS